MTALNLQAVEAERKEAAEKASAWLQAHEFELNEKQEWEGQLATSDGRKHAVIVTFPSDFPDSLPEVFLSTNQSGHIAHVDHRGKVCIAPEDGILLDTERPEAIVEQVLTKATQTLSHSLSEDCTEDIQSEFLAYWSPPNANFLFWIGPTLATARQIYLTKCDGFYAVAGGSYNDVNSWCCATRRVMTENMAAFFVPLNNLPNPPAYKERFTLRAFQELVRDHASAEMTSKFNCWLETTGLPAIILLSAPGKNSPSGILFAVHLLEPIGKPAREITKGFRPGKIPNNLLIARMASSPIERLSVTRGDPDFLILRGGGILDLKTRSVCIIGCGAVGSYIASNLASSGVGTLVLVDHEALAAANVHRHLLGTSHVGDLKTSGMEKHLKEQFPHIKIAAHKKRVEQILEESADVVLNTDVIVVAVGNETLERRLNRILGIKRPRIHVWIEPLGLGGHALTIGHGEIAGCFECLYTRDESGLRNMASLLQPNQDFQRHLGGCSGTFTPFGNLDAQRAALEASRLTIDVLAGHDAEPRLVSWLGTTQAAIQQGLILSRRGEMMHKGEINERRSYARKDCPVCGSQS